jgi:hypothetical protein
MNFANATRAIVFLVIIPFRWALLFAGASQILASGAKIVPVLVDEPVGEKVERGRAPAGKDMQQILKRLIS